MTQDFRTIFDNVSFFSKASHELRTPVHGIRGLSQHLRDNWNKLDENTKKLCINDISETSHFLTELVEKLFQLANISNNNSINFHFEKLNIIKIIKEVIERSNLLIINKDSINIFLDCDEEEINIFVDQFWIKQLLSNLISNSIKHSGGKNIRIKIDTKQVSDKQNLNISIIDDGLGVPQNELESIFDPFKQGSNIDKSLKGSGLGLTICREIVAAHNGNIWAKNNDGDGIAISFSLPRTREDL
jgi:K+-sensing histidine kinase KdpD